MNTLNPIGVCKAEIEDSLKNAISEMGLNVDEISLETPPGELGDLAFSCFSLAKFAKKAPQDIAKEISEKIVLGDHIEKMEQKGPYINFFFNSEKLTGLTLKAIFHLKDDFGDSPKKERKIILEHTSANPTDKLHIGRARNPIIGDTLARILQKAGLDVETQYYVDDMGKQAVTLAYGVEIWDSKPQDDDSLGPYQYASKMVSESSDHEAVRDDWLTKLEGGNPEITEKVRKACERVMNEDITSSLGVINVSVDRYVYESQFVEDGSVEKVIDELSASQHCDLEEGAKFIDLEPYTKTEGKFFFLRSNGTSLYATRDIAYHLWKYQNCDDIINILGEDHKLESQQVRIGLKIMGLDKYPEVIFYSFVSLPEGRMSTRKGRVVFLDDLITEAKDLAYKEVEMRREDLTEETKKDIANKVAIGAIRYNIVRVQPEKKIVFRWEDAMNFEGNSAPFIQYSHARASSILRKASGKDEDYSHNYNASLLDHDSELLLIKKMASFPEILSECADRRTPHLIAAYSFELASAFNQFYRDCPVLACEDEKHRNSRLNLVSAAQIVLKNALFCLGIEAPSEM
jgi:arginyl-tRNA synthetase